MVGRTGKLLRGFGNFGKPGSTYVQGKKKNHNKNRGEATVVKVNRNQTRCHSN